MRASTVILLAVAAQSVIGGSSASIQGQKLTNVTDSTFDVLGTVWHAVDRELEESRLPWAVALIALAFGLVLLIKGKLVFDWAVMGVIGVVMGIVAKQGVLSSWDDDKVITSKQQAANVVGLIAAAFTVFAASIGFRGILVMLGTAVGFYVADFVQNFLVINLSANFLKKIEVEVVWYSLVCLCCAFAVYKEKHTAFFAWLCPFPGGIFTASGVLYFTTEAFAKLACQPDENAQTKLSCPGGLTPKTGQWIEFFNLAFAPFQGLDTNKDVGIFYSRTISMDTDPAKSKVSGVGQDHIVTLSLWFVFTVIGLFVQRGLKAKTRTSSASKLDKRVDMTKAEKKAPDDKTSKGLDERLIPKADGKSGTVRAV